MAWRQREQAANLVLALAERRQAIMDRLLQYREDNAPPGREQLPQEAAADRAGVSTRQWQRWESGETAPHPKNLEALSQSLDIPVAEFFPIVEREESRETPDLMGQVNGNGPADELSEIRTQLDRIEGKLDAAMIANLEERIDGLFDTVTDQSRRIDELRRAIAQSGESQSDVQ